jgi:hypothetical protein
MQFKHPQDLDQRILHNLITEPQPLQQKLVSQQSNQRIRGHNRLGLLLIYLWPIRAINGAGKASGSISTAD